MVYFISLGEPQNHHLLLISHYVSRPRSSKGKVIYKFVLVNGHSYLKYHQSILIDIHTVYMFANLLLVLLYG